MSDVEYEYDYGDYGDDYGGGDGDDAGEQAVTWETEVENIYATAKYEMDANPTESAAAFAQVMSLDKDKGKWSWKALKMLARLHQRQGSADAMIPAFRAMVTFDFAGRSRAMLEKAISKYIDRCNALPAAVAVQVYSVALEVLKGDFEKIVFICKHRIAQYHLQEKNLEEAERMLLELQQWALAGPEAAMRKGTQLMTVYASLMELYEETGRNDNAREVFAKASACEAVVPSFVTAVIQECGARVYMQQEQWEQARTAYLSAFLRYDEGGDTRRIRALKSLVLATMLAKEVSDTVVVNPFDSPEAAAYKSDPEIVAISALIDAAEKKDVSRFEAIISDPKNKRAIYGDPQFLRYLEPLLQSFRLDKLQSVCAPFTQVRLSYIGEKLNISTEAAESLCIAAILEGRITGLIDQPNGAVLLAGPASANVGRYTAIEAWGREAAASILYASRDFKRKSSERVH